ncbi:hypothetical protein IVB46_19270 [Bradyrhizobium sp. 61]|uniref:hypothetical protein n=1 Tax=Bradyrhizobium sp. 61 TaxID=2782679 RepID=UPI001FFA8EF1|nr:hypothetical protein [Bradyrhizobium sp. 61]MCK1277371.1 hypothetical protein [Bradyrhizobium sp. 61]
MTSQRIRKIAALMMAMVLAVGLTTHGVGLPNMSLKSSMTAALMDTSMPVNAPMPGKCKGCIGDEQGVAPAVCSAFCSAVIALPTAPAILLAGPAETLKPVSGPDGISHVDRPELHPPRTIILS